MKIFVMYGARLTAKDGHLLILPVIEKATPEYLPNRESTSYVIDECNTQIRIRHNSSTCQ